MLMVMLKHKSILEKHPLNLNVHYKVQLISMVHNWSWIFLKFVESKPVHILLVQTAIEHHEKDALFLFHTH